MGGVLDGRYVGWEVCWMGGMLDGRYVGWEVCWTWTASSTCFSVATCDNVMRAKDSEMRMIASNWRTVMGMAGDPFSLSCLLVTQHILLTLDITHDTCPSLQRILTRHACLEACPGNPSRLAGKQCVKKYRRGAEWHALKPHP
jgi:hypothetical protein